MSNQVRLERWNSGSKSDRIDETVHLRMRSHFAVRTAPSIFGGWDIDFEKVSFLPRIVGRDADELSDLTMSQILIFKVVGLAIEFTFLS